jgi:hypothetical protein
VPKLLREGARPNGFTSSLKLLPNPYNFTGQELSAEPGASHETHKNTGETPVPPFIKTIMNQVIMIPGRTDMMARIIIFLL